jgi:hypothetical protein
METSSPSRSRVEASWHNFRAVRARRGDLCFVASDNQLLTPRMLSRAAVRSTSDAPPAAVYKTSYARSDGANLRRVPGSIRGIPSNHPLAALISHELADELRDLLASDYRVTGSPVRGNWAETPWMAIFDPWLPKRCVRLRGRAPREGTKMAEPLHVCVDRVLPADRQQKRVVSENPTNSPIPHDPSPDRRRYANGSVPPWRLAAARCDATLVEWSPPRQATFPNSSQAV